MRRVMNKIVKWQKKQFPKSGTLSKLIHLREEIGELEISFMENQNLDYEDAVKKKEFELELADCIFLLVGIADVENINLNKILEEKLKINKKRKWKEPTSEGVYFHIKE